MTDAVTLTMLVPGSIWIRDLGDGKPARKQSVLHITNQNLTPKVQAKNPPQVVFMTEQGFVLSQGIEKFLESRTFYSMDGRLESLLTQLTEVEEEEEAELNPIEDTVIPTDEPVSSETNLVDSNKKVFDLNVGDHPLASLLDANLVSYMEEPYYNGDTLHILTFNLSNGLDLNAIGSAFKISDPNAISKFTLTSDYETTMVDIDSYVDTMLKVDRHSNNQNVSDSFGVLYILSSGDFRAPLESIDSIPLEEPATDLEPAVPSHNSNDFDDQVIDMSAVPQQNTLQVS